MRLSTSILLILIIVNASFSQNISRTRDSDNEGNEKTSGEITNLNKKKSNKDRSTSSSSGEEKSGETGADSLNLKESSGSFDSSKKKTKKPSYIPKSSEERRGWRKWHRKCKKCPADMKKKWRDYTIQWICGGYQRARRTFKSKCMMEYRNCQDGTMFVKISHGRCKNETGKENYFHGDHFFYEYRVVLSDETTDSKSTSTDNGDDDSSEHYIDY